MTLAHTRRAARNFATALDDVFDVRDAGRQGEGDLLNRRRAGFARMIAADVHGIVARKMLRAEDDAVAYEAHRGPRRIDPLFLRDVFLDDVVLDGSGEFLPIEAALFGGGEVHRKQDPGRRVDGHRDRDILEIDVAIEVVHVVDGVDRDALSSHLAFAARIVAVVSHERRHVEIGRDSGLALRDQELEAGVRVVGRSEAGDLAHRPGLRAIHRRVGPARVGRLPREAEVGEVVESCDVGRRVDALQFCPAQRAKCGAPFRPRFDERPERQLLPLVLRFVDAVRGRLTF
jgi:hypothetical protein